MSTLKSIAAAAALAWVVFAGSALAQGLEGTWRAENQSEITISRCGPGYCGHISKIVVPEAVRRANQEILEGVEVEEFIDVFNKDPALRKRPILGLQILTTEGRNGQVMEGEVYNPQDGNTYRGKLEVVGPNRIRLSGCVLLGLICRGEDWQRI